jgi:uncharacterized protein YdiU (UPF0061 family)
VVTTGEQVVREDLVPGAVLTRVAASHIRVGTFEYFAARNDREAVSLLLDYVITRHYPETRAPMSPRWRCSKRSRSARPRSSRIG